VPIGQPYPPPTGGTPGISGGEPAGSAGPGGLLGALEKWSGSGSTTFLQHTTITATRITAFHKLSARVVCQGVLATAVVVVNRTGQAVAVSPGTRPSASIAGYQYIVGAGEVLAARIAPTRTIQLAGSSSYEPFGFVDVYLLSGAFAASCPGVSLTALAPVSMIAKAIASTTTVATSLTFYPAGTAGPSPFTGFTAHLDSVSYASSAVSPGRYQLSFPSASRATTTVYLRATGAYITVPMGGVVVGGPNKQVGLVPPTAATTPAVTWVFHLVYRPTLDGAALPAGGGVAE